MVQMNFNAEEHKAEVGFEPIADGEYKAIITESEAKSTKSGTGEYLQLTIQLLEEPYKNRTIIDRLNIQNPNKTAVSIAQSRLSAICKALDIIILRDSSELHNKPLIVKVGQEKSGDYINNNIKLYSKLETSTPMASSEVVVQENDTAVSNNKPTWT